MAGLISVIVRQVIGRVTTTASATDPQTLLSAVAAATTSSSYNCANCVYHTMVWSTTGPPTHLRIQMEGSLDNSTFVAIHPVQTNTAGGTYSQIGYWPYIRINLAALTGGTVTAKYIGRT